jgi:ribosomal protein L14
MKKSNMLSASMTGILLPVARGLLAIACLAFAGMSPAADTVCAQVKIEIAQELTLERQAFDAMMKITNGLDTNPLEAVDITVTFKDEAGNAIRATSDPNDTTASFFIRVDTLSGVTNITGSGSVAPKTVAEIHWLIIPAPGSGGTVPKGKLYFIGATLKYSVGGKAESVTVTPDFIYVKPTPLLTLDYFLTQDVFGDDPLTPQIEPIEPYTLGVRVKNTGAATAKNVKIDSAQPKIVENNQGLLIGFKIIGSFLNDQPTTPSLLIPFGDVPANGASSGRWLMTSTLAGRFIEFSASFSHADELGGAVTSLLQATNTHFLIRDVKVDLTGRDNIRDFLALDGTTIRVYESSGLDTVVTDQSNSSALSATGTGTSGEALYIFTTAANAGVMYAQVPDPFNGTKAMGRVTRSDGKAVAPENVWLSKKRNVNKTLSYFFNLFDANTTGIYNVALTNPAATPRPPVIQFIPDRTVPEGTQVSFLVESSDPDGTLPTLTVSSVLPSGARFTAQVPSGLTARAIFDWTPGTGQAGRYPITFTASDGALTASATTVITVTGPIAAGGPDTPVIAAPPVATDVGVLRPDLSVAASANPLDTATSYGFELYSDAQFVARIAQSPAIARTPDGATWKVPADLADNSNYYWRVRATDGTAFSPWATGRFFVNTANDAPDAVTLASPANGTTVATTAPTLTASNTTDPDSDVVTYGFDVYTDSALTQRVAQIANIAAGASGTTSWVVTPALADTTLYYWRATASDPHGAKSISATGTFLVNIAKPAPGAPTIAAPAAGGVVTTANVDLIVGNSTKPEGTVLSYYFELDRNSGFASSNIVRSGARPEGTNNTSFTVTGLTENTRYFWRAKSSDGLTDSPWVYGAFFVDQANDAPSAPTLKNPGDNSWQTTRTPLLEVNPSVDPEGDAIAYRFQIYSDTALTNRVGERLTNGLAWLVDPLLTDDTRYYWRARAEDLRGGVSDWSAVATFLVRTGSSTPTRATLTLTAPASIVPASGTTAAIAWEINDPEHNATISLYYDSDNKGADGTRIVADLPQDSSSTTGSYTWDVSTFPAGTYYIYAVATNRAGSTTVYAPGAIVLPVAEPRGGVTVAPTTGLQTDENGGTATFTVRLNLSPKAEVDIGLTSTHAGEARVDPTHVVFTAADWNVPKTITVTGLPDCVADGDTAYQIVTGKAVSADPDYNGVKGADVSLVNRNSTVGCPSNNAPLANAGPDQTVDGGANVILTGSGTDSDGTVVAYRWQQTLGSLVTLANANTASASFTAPSARIGASFTFELTVTDNQGATGVDAMDVTVRARPNQAPVANAGAAQTVFSGQSVTLAGSGTDSDGTIASYAWTQIAGPAVTLTHANTATASFTAPNVSTQTIFGFQLTVTDNDGGTGSATVSVTVPGQAPNVPPTANAGADQAINEGANVTLTGSGADPDGTIASYQWTQTAGPAATLTNATSSSATFIAPLVTVDSLLTFRLTVTDDRGGTGSATTNVTVRNVNQPPVANAGANQSVNEGDAVTLNGSGTDADGTIANYAWLQTAGPTVTLTNANSATATFTAPPAATDTVLTFRLTVTDNEGATGVATVNVTVRHVNRSPTANAGANQTVNEGASVTLSGSGTDPDGTIVTFAWVQINGPGVTLANANTATATFVAPQVVVDTVLTFQLTVIDNQGGSGSATTNVTVRDVTVANQPPTANAGADQAANEGTAVTLTGSGTDSDGTIASFAWTQIAGPTATLTNANTATATFTAPQVAVDTVLTFRLTVTDNGGASGSATTNVTVRNVNQAPTANAGPDQTVDENVLVTLSGSGADPDGTIASYQWAQTAGRAVTLSGANTATATFISPQVGGASTLTFQLTVTDNQGATGAATVSVKIRNNIANALPTANAGAAQTVDENTGVTLTGSGTDSDGTIVAFQWVQTAGPAVVLSGANAATATFIAPEVTANTVLKFQLTVTDNGGATAIATTQVTVRNVNRLPTANAGPDVTVNEGDAVSLTGSGTDPDGTIASYKWTRVAGPTVTLTGASTQTVTFTAPQVTADTVLTLQLQVADNNGGTGTDTVDVLIRNVNKPPVANAKPDKSVNEGATVTLNGVGTDPDGTIASFFWAQIAGPTVTLSDPTIAAPTFVAPQVTVDTVLTFQLTVTDNNGATGSDTINVTVRNVNQKPIAKAGASQKVKQGTLVQLDGTGSSDPDGTIIAYQWTQTAGPAATLTAANTATPTFTAPPVTANTALKFQLTVTDNLGATASSTVTITVTP